MKTIHKVIIAISTISLFAIVGASPNPEQTPAQQSTENTTHINSDADSSIKQVQAPTTAPEPIAEPVEPKIVTKTETKQQEIKFTTTTKDDPTLAKGTTKVATKGVPGIREYTYTVTYTDDLETSRELVSTKVVKEPVTEVILNGTYVAPKLSCENGTYVNTAGQTVCRPSNSNTGGATAICRDGTYSYSQSRRGTCSHHGGVKTWL